MKVTKDLWVHRPSVGQLCIFTEEKRAKYWPLCPCCGYMLSTACGVSVHKETVSVILT